MKETLLDIIQDIKEHADKEHDQGKSVRAICRGNVNFVYAGKPQPRCVWITNTEPTFVHDGPRYSDGRLAGVDYSSCNALMERGDMVVSKNRTYAQRILQYFDGHHEVVFNKRQIVFDIISSANFINPSNGRSSDVTEIQLGIVGMKDFMHFKDIETALSQLTDLVNKQKAAAKKRRKPENALKTLRGSSGKQKRNANAK